MEKLKKSMAASVLLTLWFTGYYTFLFHYYSSWQFLHVPQKGHILLRRKPLGVILDSDSIICVDCN